MNIRKSAFFFLPVLLVTVAMAANAQMMTGGGTATVGTAQPGYIVGSGPVLSPNPGGNVTGFVQFNNLIVQNVSGTNAPAEIVATNQFYPQPQVLGGAAGASNASGASGNSVMPSATCYRFNSQDDENGAAAACPVPPQPAPAAANGNQMPSTTPTASGPANIAWPVMPPTTQYRIEVSANTVLLLRDRSAATLSNFSQGDQINVFGYYNSDGSIQAYLIRDLSQPVETETEQLNNVTLVSVSASTTPATLAVTQGQGAPCYGFGGSSGGAMMMPCPLGVSSFSANRNTANVSPLPSLMPYWIMLRKYVVNVDAHTIILDRNRTQLSLASLNIGDSLNIYGETSDNGRTVSADIIRDLSIPAAPAAYSGSVTQVNADGSFVIQTNDGRTLTVQNPISTGQRVTVFGLLNTAQNVISQVTQLMMNSATTISPPPGIMVPMMGKPLNQ